MKTKIIKCPITEQIQKNFTIDGDETSFEPHQLDKEQLPENFNIGVIIGKSGSGKTILLKEFGKEQDVLWDDRAIASHFENYEDAEQKLLAAGLGSIPTWLKPYHILSNGEKHRADLARMIDNNIVIDEFVSYVDSNASLGLCNSIQNYIRKNNITGVVVATLNREIIDYLKPCWVYDTDKKELIINSDLYNVEIEDNKVKIKKALTFMKIN